jgi:hypothetical protein
MKFLWVWGTAAAAVHFPVQEVCGSEITDVMVQKWMLCPDCAVQWRVYNSRQHAGRDANGQQVTAFQVGVRSYISALHIMHKILWSQNCWEDRISIIEEEIRKCCEWDQAWHTCSFTQRKVMSLSHSLWSLCLSVHWEIKDNIDGVETPCLQQKKLKTENSWTMWCNATPIADVVGMSYPCTIKLNFAPSDFHPFRPPKEDF